MRLGQIIDKLEAMPSNFIVRYEKVGDVFEVGEYPRIFQSYRGYYECLALDWGDKPCTVLDLLQRCKEADGKVFYGYKGGDYLMDRETLVWIAEYGCCSETRPVAIEMRDGYVALLVASVPQYWG